MTTTRSAGGRPRLLHYPQTFPPFSLRPAPGEPATATRLRLPETGSRGGRRRGKMIRQLQSDVNLDEEAELRRLESGAPPPMPAVYQAPPPPTSSALMPPPAAKRAKIDKLFDEPAMCKQPNKAEPLGRLEVQKVEKGAQIEWQPDTRNISGKKMYARDVKTIQVTKPESNKAMVQIVAKSDAKHIFNFLVPGSDFKVRPHQLSAPVGLSPPLPVPACPCVVVRRRSATRTRTASETPSSLT